jgi:O-antigen/teichoic acid export membrane protein
MVPTIGLVIFIPVYLLLKGPISTYFITQAALVVDYYYWIIIFVIFLVFWIIFETYSNLLMRIAIPKLIREIVVRVLLLTVYVLFAFKYIHINGLVGGIISVYGVAMLLMFIYVSRIGPVSLKHDFSYVDKPLRKKIRNYTLFLVLSALSGNILGMLDTIMITAMKGFDFTGIYTIAFFMAAVVDIPSRSISAISSPVAAKAMKEGDRETANKLYKKVSLHQLITGSIIFLLIWINIDNIFAIIPNGEKYIEGKWVVFFLAMGRMLNVTFNFGAILVSYSKYYYWGLFFTVFITITGIFTNLLLIPRFAITGAAIGTLITCLLLNTVQQWIVMIKIKATPISKGLIKYLILMLIIYGINYLLPQWSSNPFVDGIYRTLIIGTITLLSVYKLNISDEITTVFNQILLKVKHYK